jgi:hypothetical protein
MAEAYKHKGLLPESFEVRDDLSSAELFDALYDTAQAKAREDVETEFQEKGYNDQVFEYVQFLSEGGNPQVIQQHNIYDRLANFDPSSDDDHKLLVKAMLQDKQLDEDTIEDTLETLEVNDKLEVKAQQAKEYFSRKRDDFFEEQRELTKQQQKAYQDEVKRQEDGFRKIIKKGQVGPFKLSPTDAKELEKAFLERTEVVVQPTADGKQQKVKVTKFEKMMGDIRQDPEKTLQFAYMVLKGVDNVRQKIGSEAREEFLNVLDAKKKLETVRPPARKPARTVFQDFADSQPIIMKY